MRALPNGGNRWWCGQPDLSQNLNLLTLLPSGGRRPSASSGAAAALRRGSLVGVPLGARRGSILLGGSPAVPALQAG